MKNTKTKLISSVTVLLICFAMLIGSTFAWFTDSASTGVNKIQAGNLNIEAYYQNSVSPSTDGALTFNIGATDTRITNVSFESQKTNIEGQKLIDGTTLFEPGYVGAKLITVENEGNLAAKIAMSVATNDQGLMNALWFDFVMVNLNQVNAIGTFEPKPMNTINTVASNIELDLDKNASVSFIFIYGMNESAGNEFQGKSFEASVTILARQNKVENDSFDNKYDKDSKYPNTVSAIVTTEDNVVKNQVEVSTATKNADGNPIATVTIPAGVKVADGVNTITTTVEPTTTPSNMNVAVTSDSQTFEVKVEGLHSDNAEPLTVEAYIGKNLNNVQVYHDGVPMDSSAYSYEGSTGYVKFSSASFSPFTVTYDKKAPIVYPAGVTTESFKQATSVYYYGTYGGGTHVRVATGDDIKNHPAAVAYVGTDGVVYYAADVYCAVYNGATAIYCKENATLKVRSVDTNRTEDLTKDLTIYANGADFQYGEIALNSTTTAAQDITVNVYDAKNLYIWGYSPAGGKDLTVLMKNCHNIGISETNTAGRMFYISNNSERTNGTIHAILNSCSVEKSDSPVYMNADGSLTLENCTFAQCAVPVNNNYKSAGTRTDVVKDCKFISCGCTAEKNSGIASYAAPIRFVKSGTGTLTVKLENNTFNGTIGTNGDILLGDYRTPGKSFAFDATIDTANSVMVKSSTEAAYSYNGGTVNVLGY